ncbi:MAG TPA: PQQ-binding-like beta-propeller repeat protein [bacterium]|nr:PQQ-binding-like beta-propeller repeat protein [bacterium]
MNPSVSQESPKFLPMRDKVDLSRPARLAAFIAVFALGWIVPAFGQSNPINVHCRAFHDLDQDGTLDDGEPGIPGIRITNGDDVFLTDAQGELDLVVDRALYRFATITTPAGWWPTNSWFRWVPVAMSGPDSANFGLRQRPETASDPIRWIHVADTQTQGWNDPWRFDDDLLQINQLLEPPLMIINTGDLVEVGSDTTHWDNYMEQISVSNYPIFPVVGNHDTLGTATPLDSYEKYVGPPYYSFEMGSYHFLVYNNEAAPIGTPQEDLWLDRDVAKAPPGSHFLLFQHRMIKELPPSKANHWDALGIQAVFSGHWHTTQLTKQANGMVDYNICRTRSGGLDHTARSFAIVTCSADGSIDYEMRRLAVNHTAAITHPAAGEITYGNSLDVLVETYDTSAKVTSVTASISGTGGTTPLAGLVREGPFLWRATIDLSALPSGPYTLSVNGNYDDSQTFVRNANFTRSQNLAPTPQVGEAWTMLRRDSKGTGFAPSGPKPPLSLAWTRPVPGMVELSSPVTADGRVFLGTRSENQMSEAGVSAFDAVQGTPLWFTNLAGGVALAPAVADNIVIVTTMSDSAFGLNAVTGQRLWAKWTPGVRYDMTAPIYEGTKTWVSAEPRSFQLNWSNGATDWSSATLGNDWFPYIYSAPAVGPNYLYYGLFGFDNENYGGFTIVNRTNGTLFTKQDGAFRSPIWADSLLYVVGDPNRNAQKLTARDPVGNVMWTSPIDLGGGTGSPVIGHGILVVPGKDGRIEGINASNGASIWTKAVGNVLLDVSNGVRGGKATPGTPAIADSVVYVGSADGKLYALDLFTGSELWSWSLGVPITSSPIVTGDLLFVGACDNHLYAFTSALPTSPTGVLPGMQGDVFRFEAPWPNPSSALTDFRWSLPAAMKVRLRILDVSGRLVRKLADGRMEPGAHAVSWDGRDDSGEWVGAGVYFAWLEAGSSREAKKVVRLSR